MQPMMSERAANHIAEIDLMLLLFDAEDPSIQFIPVRAGCRFEVSILVDPEVAMYSVADLFQLIETHRTDAPVSTRSHYAALASTTLLSPCRIIIVSSTRFPMSMVRITSSTSALYVKYGLPSSA